MAEFQNMGEATSKVFSGEGSYEANREMYAETAHLFASVIKQRLHDDRMYSIADVGSFQGELLTDLLQQLPGYQFKTTAVDVNRPALVKNESAHNKIVAQAERLPFADKSIDVAMMRYVLQWNNPDKQKEILKELARVVKEFAIIEHVGSDNIETDEWRRRTDILFAGQKIPKMKRGEHFFSSRDEVEAWMTDAGIAFERLRDRTIANGADVYIERYSLDRDEAEEARGILGDKNYFRQTDWVILPKE